MKSPIKNFMVENNKTNYENFNNISANKTNNDINNTLNKIRNQVNNSNYLVKSMGNISNRTNLNFNYMINMDNNSINNINNFQGIFQTPNLLQNNCNKNSTINNLSRYRFNSFNNNTAIDFK
jgi:paraquat-inducible protein B